MQNSKLVPSKTEGLQFPTSPRLRWAVKIQNYLLLLSALCLTLYTGNVLAQTADFSVSVTPLVREINANPGEVVSGTVDVTNPLSTAQTFYPLARDFAPSKDSSSAAPEFYEQTPEDYAYALSKWVSFGNESIDIKSKATASIAYKIAIPKNAEPGGHYGAIFASSEAPKPSGSDSQVTIGARVGSLVLVTVSGDIKSKGEIVSFKADKKIYAKPPAKLLTTIKNSGNVHLKPSGEIKITGWSATEESLKFNEAGGNVLPESERTYTNETKTLSWGRYYAKADLSLLSPTGDKIPFQAVANFWIIPIIPILIGLAILIVIIFFWRKWLKKHDQEVKKELKK